MPVQTSPLHPRNAQLKRELLQAPLTLCFERALHYTHSHAESEGQHPSIRAAKAFQAVFENMSISISPHERLVGNRSSKTIAPPLATERGDFTFLFKYRLPELEDFGYKVGKKEKNALFDDIIPYWEGKTVRQEKVRLFEEHGLNSSLSFSPRELKRKLRAFGLGKIVGMLVAGGSEPSAGQKLRAFLKFMANSPRYLQAMKAGTSDNVKGRGRCIDTQAHIVVGYKNVLERGFKGIKQAALDRMDFARTEDERAFLNSVLISCDAMHDFSLRFAALAREMAESERDESQRGELLEIARRCETVPWNPPSRFDEALQAMWFTQNAIIITYGAGSGITPGRVDQLLYPYYNKDIKQGRITREGALELVEELVIKFNNNVVIWPNIAGVELNHLGSDIENITLGGCDRDGNDATNELTLVFLDAIRNTKLATTASFRFSSDPPGDYVRKVMALHLDTNGPALFNDEIAVQALVNDGYSIEDARDYCLVGCVEPSGNGDTFGATGGSKVYLPSILDLVFNRGRVTFFGNVDTFDTGDPREFTAFEELKDAFYKQMEAVVETVAEATNLRDGIWARKFHNPLISCTIDGCIENGKDMTQGGAKYNFGAIGAGGLATVVDSLAAIKKFVFEERVISMQELLGCLRTDFKGKEKIRTILENGPKFGTDDDGVDAIAVELVDRFCEACTKVKKVNGGHYKASFISYGLNVYEGKLEPATPNGRKAGAPISNSMSPSNGAERLGPTAALNSLAKIDQAKIGYGNSVNMKFPTYLLESEVGIDALWALVNTYFKKGGFHLQFNIIDAETLRDAQEHPENYEDLIVRVSGYSAYFTQLGRDIQDDLITRIEFGSC